MSIPKVLTATFKRCRRCGELKPRDFYHRNRVHSDGLHVWCKSCRKETSPGYYQNRKHLVDLDRTLDLHLQRKYGINLDRYLAMVDEQNGVCAICGNPCKTHSRLTVDHDHETGRVRGLLCFFCNTVLGKVGESTATLGSMIRYLERSRTNVDL